MRLEPISAKTRDLLARLCATCPDARIRDGTKSVELAKEACTRTGQRIPAYLDTLACAYAEAGDFDQAVETLKKAMENKAYAQEQGDGLSKRLELFEAKKAYRME